MTDVGGLREHQRVWYYNPRRTVQYATVERVEGDRVLLNTGYDYRSRRIQEWFDQADVFTQPWTPND